LEQAAAFLEKRLLSWRADVPTRSNQAKQIAQELMGKSVVIYSGPKLFPAAYKWKISLNENAKHVAWVNQFPEFNHNEFVGWSKQPVDKPYAVIDLRSNLEHERVQKQFVVSTRLLSGMRPEPIVIEPQGKDILEQLLYTIALGDFVSVYLALLNGVNPAPLGLVDKLKKVMDE
jgi:glucose/mannose-6-phosphate isomerase